MTIIFMDGFDKYGSPVQATSTSGPAGGFYNNRLYANLAGEWTSVNDGSTVGVWIDQPLSASGASIAFGSNTLTQLNKTLSTAYARLIGGFRFKVTNFTFSSLGIRPRRRKPAGEAHAQQPRPARADQCMAATVCAIFCYLRVDASLIRVKREGAERSRRLAMMLTSEADRVRLLAYADELDTQADALEDAAKEDLLPPTVTQEQVQAQQGPPTSVMGDKKKS